MRFLKVSLYGYLFLANYLYAIGDGPAFDGRGILILLGIFITIIIFAIIITVLIVKKIITTKIIVVVVIVFAVLIIYKKMNPTYSDMRFIKMFYCKPNKKNEHFPISRYFKGYFKPDIMTKLTGIHEELLPCVKEVDRFYNPYEIKTYIELFMNNDLNKTVDALYEDINMSNKYGYRSIYHKSMYYYLLTKDQCIKNLIESDSKKICPKAKLNENFASKHLELVKKCMIDGCSYKSINIEKF